MAVFSRVSGEGHEEVLFGFDALSGLKTIIAIHSTALGPALGGTRFFPYSSEDEALIDVLRLAKGMTYKAAAAGLDLGGGKAVIIGDPRHDKSERLLRAYGRMVDSLGGRYITAEDVGTTANDMEMIRRETRWALGIPIEEGGSGDPSPATARGLFAGLRAVAQDLWGDEHLHGRRVAIQGVGKVGYSLVGLLVEAGCEVIVADVFEPAARRAVEDFGVKAVPAGELLAVDCDILAPCTMGAVLDEETIPALRCTVVLGSANNQLADDALSDLIAERGILYVPDFVVNAGGLINVYEELRGYSPTRAMHRVDSIFEATKHVLELAHRHGTTPLAAAKRLAESRIEEIGDLSRFRRSGDDRN